MEILENVGLIFLGLLLLVFLFAFLSYGKLYLRSVLTKAGVGIFDMIAMQLRKVSPGTMVDAAVMLVQARLEDIDKRDLEAHYLAGGHVMRVVQALISADRAGLDLDFRTAASIDLAGRDVLEAVKASVTPKVIDCPNPESGKTTIAAVAKDGIQVLAKARVTVRTNIARLVGGAGEETIIARVGEGIVSTIGSKDTHALVLENPDDISKVVLSRGLDAGTAFEIVSIDIADVDIGINIGARLQADQAEADKRVAQALAEKIARNSPGAMMASKKAMWRSLDMGLRESLDMGIGLVTDFWGHPDDREGTVAFAEKREPRWAPPGKLQDKAQGKAREAES